MVSGEVVTALIVGLTGLVALFFGRAYWSSFSGLIEDQKKEVARLQDLVRKQRDRLDGIENRLHKKDLELLQVQTNLDNYVATSQNLTEENRRLRQRVKELEAVINPPNTTS